MPDRHVAKHEDATSNGPVDLAALQADNVLMDAVVRAAEEGSAKLFGLDTDATGHRLGAMLLAWRLDVDAQPIPELVSMEQAGAALAAARPKHRPARLVPLTAAAACLVIACSGLALTAHSATPNSPLWGVSMVLYSERAVSVQAAATVTKEFDDTRRALASGNIDQARKALADASNALAAVRPEEGRSDLTVQQNMLTSQLQRSAPPRQTAGSLPTVGQPQGSSPAAPAPARPIPAPPPTAEPPAPDPATPDPATPAPPTTEPPAGEPATPDPATPAPPTTEPPQHGRPHHGPPRHGPPHHDPPRHDPPRHDPPHQGPPRHDPPGARHNGPQIDSVGFHP